MAEYYIGNMAFDSEYLKHHGRLGQRKGRRNGPPYPLGAGQLSAAEAAAGGVSPSAREKYGDKSEKESKSEKAVSSAKNTVSKASDSVRKIIDNAKAKHRLQKEENERIKKETEVANIEATRKAKEAIAREKAEEEGRRIAEKQFKDFSKAARNELIAKDRTPLTEKEKAEIDELKAKIEYKEELNKANAEAIKRIEEKEKERILNSGSAIELEKLKGKISTQEMQSAINRLKVEAELQSYIDKEKISIKDKEKSQKLIFKILNNAQTIEKYVNNAVTIGSSIQKFKSLFAGNSNNTNSFDKALVQLLNKYSLSEIENMSDKDLANLVTKVGNLKKLGSSGSGGKKGGGS